MSGQEGWRVGERPDDAEPGIQADGQGLAPCITATADRTAIRLLVAAGYITQAKANEALNIAHGFDKGPLSAPVPQVGVDEALRIAYSHLDMTALRVSHCKDAAKIETALAAGALPQGETWRPMDTAPRDGTMLRLLVEFTEHATEDSRDPSPTIGANNFDNDGEDRWQFAGWCWTHDHFTEGKGAPVGWLPMLAAAPAQGVR